MNKFATIENKIAGRRGASPKSFRRRRSEGEGPRYLKLSKRVTYPVRYIEEIQNGSGVMFTPYDLRRTLITTAESLDLSAYPGTRPVSQKTSDVTAGCIIANVERLRRPIEQTADFLLNAGLVKPKTGVISMEAVKTEQHLMAANK